MKNERIMQNSVENYVRSKNMTYEIINLCGEYKMLIMGDGKTIRLDFQSHVLGNIVGMRIMNTTIKKKFKGVESKLLWYIDKYGMVK